MSSKRQHEGYLQIDHRDSPGVSRDTSPQVQDVPFFGSGLFESATITCSHCQRVVVLNPDRSRERGYCKKCDHYICDTCSTLLAKTMECVPFRKILDDAQEEAILAAQRGDSLIVTHR